MARRRPRNHQPRYESDTERSFQEYIFSTPAPQITRTELLRLIRGGEDTYLELKVQLSNAERIAQGICALANTGGGFMVFGVDDQLRVQGLDDLQGVQSELVRICREEIAPALVPLIGCYSLDNGRTMLALEVKGRQRPYRTRDGRYYIRIGAEKREATIAELTALLDDARPLAYEELPAPGASMDDIDEQAFWSFVARVEGASSDTFKLKNGEYASTGEAMRSLLLATGGEIVVPTVAGLLLFGRAERVAQILPRAEITLTRYEGETIQTRVVEQGHIRGDAQMLFRESLRFIERYADLWDARPPRRGASADADADGNGAGASPVRARANYPRRAAVEALVNLIVHRDLAVRDRPTQVHLYESAIDFSNPRRSHGFTDRAARAIRFGVPQRVNPILHALFINPAYEALAARAGEAADARGLPMILREAQAWNNSRAELYLDNDRFRLKLYAA